MANSETLNNLNGYVGIVPQPYLIPKYYPYAPVGAPTFDPFHCIAIQNGFTTLDAYEAPGPPALQNYYTSTAQSGNGYVFAGNAPMDGIYTGIQQE